MATLAIAAVIGASGCNGGSTTTVTPTPYYTSWYDVYGHYCGNTNPMPGCNFYSNGTKIQDYQDPYYANKVLQYSSNWTYTDSYGYAQSYSGYAWLSNDGILFDDFGRALNEVDQTDSHDLLGEAADLEAQAIDGAGKALAGRFALAEDRAIEIARTLNDWAVLGKTRARTDADTADYAQRIYGVSASAATAALASAERGDLSSLKSLNAQVAAYWGTNAETSQAILSAWYADEAAALSK
jgi:hypothetical protein